MKVTRIASEKNNTPKNKLRVADRERILLEASTYIKENIADNVSLNKTSEHTGFSKYSIRKAFMELMGITPKKYMDECRIQIFKDRLNSGIPLPKAIYMSGRNSQSWQYGSRKNQLGMSVKKFRRGGDGIEIRYSIVESALGHILVAETQNGVCSVLLSNSVDMLEATLIRSYPSAHIRKDVAVKETAKRVVLHINGNTQKFNLDINGTPFQRKVWEAISKVPYGETRTYEEIATITGNAKSQRAVANACATNPVPLIIPCHRILRKNGTLGGYGPGIDKKIMILKIEKEKKEKSL